RLVRTGPLKQEALDPRLHEQVLILRRHFHVEQIDARVLDLVRRRVGIRRERRPVAEVAVDPDDGGRASGRRRKHAGEDWDDHHEGHDGGNPDDRARPVRLRRNPRGAVATPAAVRESVSVGEAVRRALAERQAVDRSRRQTVHPAFREAIDSTVCPPIRTAVRPARAGPTDATVHMATPGGTGGREAAGPQAGDRRLEGSALRPLEPVRPFETIPGVVGTAESVEDLTLRPPGHNQGRVRAKQGVIVAERLDETRVDGLGRGGGGRLLPARREGQRVRKSFTTPFAFAVGMVGLAVVTAVPQIAHSVSSEKRYPPHRGQKGELSSRLGWNPGSSASSSEVY